MEIGSLTSIIAVGISVVVTLFGAFRYVTAMGDSLRRETQAVLDQARLATEKGDEAEARQRHSMANSLQTIMAKLDADVRTLQREAVRQEQMNALETRLGNSLGKIEAKVDRLTEATAEISVLRNTLQGISRSLEDITRRLDAARRPPAND